MTSESDDAVGEEVVVVVAVAVVAAAAAAESTVVLIWRNAVTELLPRNRSASASRVAAGI